MKTALEMTLQFICIAIIGCTLAVAVFALFNHLH